MPRSAGYFCKVPVVQCSASLAFLSFFHFFARPAILTSFLALLFLCCSPTTSLMAISTKNLMRIPRNPLMSFAVPGWAMLSTTSVSTQLLSRRMHLALIVSFYDLMLFNLFDFSRLLLTLLSFSSSFVLQAPPIVPFSSPLPSWALSTTSSYCITPQTSPRSLW